MSKVGTFDNIFQRRGILNGQGVAKVGNQIYPTPTPTPNHKDIDVVIGGRYQHKATGLIMKLEMGSWTDNEVRLVESDTFAKQGFKNSWTGSIDELVELWEYKWVK